MGIAKRKLFKNFTIQMKNPKDEKKLHFIWSSLEFLKSLKFYSMGHIWCKSQNLLNFFEQDIIIYRKCLTENVHYLKPNQETPI